MQVGGGPVLGLGLGLGTAWGHLPRSSLPGSPLPREEDGSEENLVPKVCQLLTSQLKGRSWDRDRGLGFMPPEATAVTRSCPLRARMSPNKAAECSGEMEPLGLGPRGVPLPVWGSWWGQGLGARSPLGSCGSAWSTSAGGPRAGPQWHGGRPPWTAAAAAAGSAGRAWGPGRPVLGGGHWTW